MEQTKYLIKEAAQKIEVENHVLRYWEEELGLPIRRTEQGHRYYTDEDLATFQFVKDLKKQGYQLKAIKRILEEKASARNHETATAKGRSIESEPEISILDSNTTEDGHTEFSIIARPGKQNRQVKQNDKSEYSQAQEEKALRLQAILKQAITEAVKEHDEKLCEEVKESVIKELDYQFRVQEEEHLKHLDELLRNKQQKGKRKKHSFF